MTDAVLGAAAWIALASAVLAMALVTVFAVRAWRDWRQMRLTQDAALALVDVHVERVVATIDEANGRLGGVADRGEQLAGSLGQLREDVSTLRWLLERIPAERDRLRAALLELVLPTKRRDETEDVARGGT